MSHILLCTQKTKRVANNIRHTLNKNGFSAKKIEELNAGELDIPALVDNYKAVIKKYGIEYKNLYFNVTSGTKPMFAAVYQLSPDITPLYLDTNSRSVMTMANDYKKEQISNFLRIEEFFNIAGYDSKYFYVTDNSENLSGQDLVSLKEQSYKMIEDRESLLHKIYNSFFVNKISEKDSNFIFDVKKNDRKTILAFLRKKVPDLPENFFPTEFNLGDRIINERLKKISDIRMQAFFPGGWFEEYAYNNLKKSGEKSGSIKEIQISCKIEKRENIESGVHDKQELDVVYTDGINLFIVECKCIKESAKQGNFAQKLESIASKVGGAFSKGIFLYAKDNTVSEAEEAKIRVSKNLYLFRNKKEIDDFIASPFESLKRK
ncbi:MAG: DUF1887 family protein [Opitutales bacterium]|nr:DUF1887 family protein [Opitutales bacterium]